MRPQLQAIRIFNPEAGLYGDCHRTCIAMILDMDRDDVPHFMDGVPKNAAHDHPAAMAAEQAERDWLDTHGLTPVSIPYPGEIALPTLMDTLAICAKDAAVILGCTSTSGTNHSVVYYRGQIYNPNTNQIAGPMSDGLWWITIYARATQPLPEPKAPASVVTQENHE